MRRREKRKDYLMNFGGFLDNNSVGGGGAKIVADIPYSDSNNVNSSNTNMPASAAIAQPRLATQSLSKSMFSSPGLSLALVQLLWDPFSSFSF